MANRSLGSLKILSLIGGEMPPTVLRQMYCSVFHEVIFVHFLMLKDETRLSSFGSLQLLARQPLILLATSIPRWRNKQATTYNTTKRCLL